MSRRSTATSSGARVRAMRATLTPASKRCARHSAFAKSRSAAVISSAGCGASRCVEIDQPSSRSIEALVEPAELIPHIAGEEEPVRLRNKTKPAVQRRFIECRDFKQTISVFRPADRVKQFVFAGLVIAALNRPALNIKSQIITETDDDRSPVHATPGP